MKTISFSVTDDQAELIAVEAEARGLTKSQLAKTSLFSHMNKYAVKGVMAHLAEMDCTRPTFVGSEGNLEESAE